jgi:hypothetical protein
MLLVAPIGLIRKLSNIRRDVQVRSTDILKVLGYHLTATDVRDREMNRRLLQRTRDYIIIRVD